MCYRPEYRGGFGLLGSIMLAGVGVMFRRRTQVSISTGSSALPITTALAMDGINQLNGSLYADFASVSNHYQSQFEPLEATLEPATAPILAVSGGGLLTRYGGSGIGPGPLVSKTAPRDRAVIQFHWRRRASSPQPSIVAMNRARLPLVGSLPFVLYIITCPPQGAHS